MKVGSVLLITGYPIGVVAADTAVTSRAAHTLAAAVSRVAEATLAPASTWRMWRL